MGYIFHFHLRDRQTFHLQHDLKATDKSTKLQKHILSDFFCSKWQKLCIKNTDKAKEYVQPDFVEIWAI